MSFPAKPVKFSLPGKVLIFIGISLWCLAVAETATAAAVPADAKPAFVTTVSEPPAKQDYVEGEVLVLLDQAPNRSGSGRDSNQSAQGWQTPGDKEIEAIAGGTIQKKITFPKPRQSKKINRQAQTADKTQAAGKSVLRIKLPKGKTVKQAIAEAKRVGLRVEPNYKLRITAIPNDTLFSYMWALRNTGQTGGTTNADIDAVSAWDITTGSPDVIVAVIDTGIDYQHPDLAANIWTNTGEIPGNGIDDDRNGFVDDVHGYDFAENDGDPMDEHSHGTHVAGTIGASGNNRTGVTGINWRCSLMACRFLDADGSGSVADAIEAINYAVANGAKILSNSWGGGGYSASLAAAITNAKENGVLFVAAAGNDTADNDTSAHYPSGYQIDNVIAVAATDDDDALAYFSNYGRNTVHLGAPGVSILSSVLDNEYEWYSGTSMATPHVSGVAALLLAQDPDMSLNELKSRLIWTGDAIPALSGKTITGKRLNAFNALTSQPGLMVFEPNSAVTWVRGFEWTIQWMSIDGGDTVDIYLLKPDGSNEQLADDTPNVGTFAWNIPETTEAGSGYKIRVDDGVNADESDVNFTISGTPCDYFTESFLTYTRGFDLSNKSLLLTPDESASRYTACLKEITELPVNPGGSEILDLDDDDTELVTLGTYSVQFYGTSYPDFYVGSNGYITFGAADYEYSESTANHFSMKRISGLFRDLNPEASGSVEVKTLDDRVAVTWLDVPEYGGTGANTFQIELFADGRIRLSWLNVAACLGLVGISEGKAIPADFLQSNLSNYQQCEPMLESVEITGPDSIAELATAQFTCVAHYEDGITEDITSSQAYWSVDSNDAVIDESGLLTAGDISDYKQCTVSAEFNGKSTSHTIIITDSSAHIIPIQKATVKAGRTTGLDSIALAGGFDATPELFAVADNITVQIYSAADDYLVYEQTINPNSFSVKQNIYTYKATASGQPGGITLLRFDMNPGAPGFLLKAKNIDLTGLRCPLYVLIHLSPEGRLTAGDYVGLGTANEDIVNGSRLIPIRLLRGYTNTLAVTKTRLNGSSKPLKDSLSLKGTITIGDEPSLTQGLTITWGTQSWTIPSGKFSEVKTGQFRCDYRTTSGASIRADFNFTRCTFKVVIKQTTIATKTGQVDFGIAFGNFAKTVRIRT